MDSLFNNLCFISEWLASFLHKFDTSPVKIDKTITLDMKHNKIAFYTEFIIFRYHVYVSKAFVPLG